MGVAGTACLALGAATPAASPAALAARRSSLARFLSATSRLRFSSSVSDAKTRGRRMRQWYS